MGSDSDLNIVNKAFETLTFFGIPYEARIISAHRTPERAAEFARAADENGFGVIIAAAGGAAHLAGAIAANTLLPVIGIPINSGSMGGIDALLSTAQMPRGIPVATVAVDGAANAAILAVQILAVGDLELTGRLNDYRLNMARKIAQKDLKLKGEKL